MFADKNQRKAIVYECLTADNCSEIIAKINFLRVRLIAIHLSIEQLGEATNFKAELKHSGGSIINNICKQ